MATAHPPHRPVIPPGRAWDTQARDDPGYFGTLQNRRQSGHYDQNGTAPSGADSLRGARLAAMSPRASKNAKSPDTIDSRLRTVAADPPARHLRRLQHARPAVGAAGALGGDERQALRQGWFDPAA
jgi:hypothetical protein